MRSAFLTTLLGLSFLAWPLQLTNAEDGHGHKENEEHGHYEGQDEHGHDEHEEGKTDIAPDHAAKAGIKLSKAQAGVIHETISLTGQIILNRDTTANVRARFPGIVRDVSVKLGQVVTKGQVLARVESNESLNVYEITAPVSGVILKRNTNAGDVTGEAELFAIADMSNVWANFHIFPRDTSKVHEKQDVIVHTLDDSVKAEAMIKLLLPMADELSQTHVAIVELDNEKGQWRPGMTVEGDVAVSQKQAGIVVSKSALQTMEEQTVVFVTEGNSFKMRPVKTGNSDSKNVEIMSGLKAGETYVSEGSFIIKADIMKSGAAHEH